MSDFWRRVKSKLFGTRYVVLIDFDGERNVRPIKFIGGKASADRYEFSGRRCWLENDGKLYGHPSYVDRWEPYELGAPKRYPTFSRAETP